MSEIHRTDQMIWIMSARDLHSCLPGLSRLEFLFLNFAGTSTMNKEQQDRLLKELFIHATESIIVIDQSGTIRLVNPATERLFGYSQETLQEKKVEFLIPERYAERHEHYREKYTAHPHSRAMGTGMDLFARRKDGSEFPVEISLSPFESDGQQFIIAFIIDITRRKEIEHEVLVHQKQLEKMTQELKETNAHLESKVYDRTKVLQEALAEIEKSRLELSEALEKEKELNELKSRFLSMASHEFRTPLTTILSSASLIPEYVQTGQQEKRLRHVERIKSAVNNLNDILSDFLSLSKIEEGKVVADLRKFNFSQVVADVINELRPITKEGQQIVHDHTGLDYAVLDPKLLRNILINLISNAIKFSPEGRVISVETAVEANEVRLDVKDEGMGISIEDQQHLFERFFRGRNATNIQGTGLGLNIVSKYVELMGGGITMESELNKGTVFRIRFPQKQ